MIPIADDFAAIRAALEARTAPEAQHGPDGVPLRLSADPEHEWYDPGWSSRVEVLLDGAPVPRAMTANSVAGWVDIVDVSQRPPGTVRRYGVVTIRKAAGMA